MADAIPLMIKNGTFRCELFDLHVAFTTLSLNTIRKLLDLVFEKPYENERAIETIHYFVETSEAGLVKNINDNNESLLKALADLEAKRRNITVLGNTLKLNIENAKRQLTEAKRKRNKDQIRQATTAYDKVRRPITEYNETLKTIKNIEKLISADQRKLKRIIDIKEEL